MRIRTIIAGMLIASVCVFADNIDASSAGANQTTDNAKSEAVIEADNTEQENKPWDFLEIEAASGDDVSSQGDEVKTELDFNTKKTGATKSDPATAAKTNTSAETKSKQNQTAATDQQAKTETKHEHSWEPVYETITVEDYGSEVHEYCKGCGADITSWSNSSWIAHSNKHLENGEESGCYEKAVTVVTATHQVQKRVGWKCSCGATK